MLGAGDRHSRPVVECLAAMRGLATAIFSELVWAGSGGSPKRNLLRSGPLDYSGIRGEGSISVPLPPPTRLKPCILCPNQLAIKPNSSSVFSIERRTSYRQSLLVLLQMTHLSPELWTLPIWYGSRNSNVPRGLRIVVKWGSAAPLGQATGSDLEFVISRFESFRRPTIPAFGQASQETREWAGNPGFSRVRFCRWTA